MSIRTATEIADQIAASGWGSRIEFAMHGEPTLNPHFIEIVGIFRDRLSNQLMMLTNGGGLVNKPREKVAALFNAGLNVLGLENYYGVNLCEKILRKINPTDGYEVKYYPEDLSASPHTRRPKRTKLLIVIDDIKEASKGTHSLLSNHCGAGSPLNDRAAGKRCARPFREMSIRWDGNIALCCNDWRGVYKTGNIHKSGIEHIWRGKEFEAARKFLYYGRREFTPCAGCDATSYRVGLLPDQVGAKTMSKPTAKDREITGYATRGRSYTVAIKREWEK